MGLKRYLQCGRVLSPHGVRGEIRAEPWTDSPGEMTALKTMYLEEGRRMLAVESARPQGGRVLVKFGGVDSRTDAETLRGAVLYADRDDIPRKKGQVFLEDLPGFRVEEQSDGTFLGILREVSFTGANNVYHVRRPDGKVVLIPAVPAVVKEIRPDERVMKVESIPGLFDDPEEVRD